MFIFIIKEIRENRKISLRKLSRLTELSLSYLFSIENNKIFNPSLLTMKKIAHVLDVKIDELFYHELDLDNLRSELHEKIDQYGIASEEALKISQIIDLFINVKMQEKN